MRMCMLVYAFTYPASVHRDFRTDATCTSRPKVEPFRSSNHITFLAHLLTGERKIHRLSYDDPLFLFSNFLQFHSLSQRSGFLTLAFITFSLYLTTRSPIIPTTFILQVSSQATRIHANACFKALWLVGRRVPCFTDSQSRHSISR